MRGVKLLQVKFKEHVETAFHGGPVTTYLVTTYLVTSYVVTTYVVTIYVVAIYCALTCLFTLISTSTRRSGCKQSINALLRLVPTHWPGLVSGSLLALPMA